MQAWPWRALSPMGTSVHLTGGRHPSCPSRVSEAMSGEEWLGFVDLELEQPANIDVGVGPALGQPREAHDGMRGRAAHVVQLSLEPVLELLHLHGDTGVAADRELRHGPRICAGAAGENGFHRASWSKSAPVVRRMIVWRMGRRLGGRALVFTDPLAGEPAARPDARRRRHARDLLDAGRPSTLFRRMGQWAWRAEVNPQPDEIRLGHPRRYW